MEPHPIPQNVTSFQFHLVGDMTLKQFLYLAIGSGIAYALFVFSAAKYPFIAWPFIIISSLSGVAFAFLPIGSRPLDYWLGAFLKAIYSPTKRIWEKNDKTYKDESLFRSRFIMYLSGLQPGVAVPIPPATLNLPTKDELGKTVDLAKEAQDLQFKIIQTERTLNQIKSQDQINQVMSNMQTLVNQASQVKSELDKVTKPEEVKVTPTKTRVVIPVKPKQTQVALTTFPNVLNGIVKDKEGKYLEGVVAVIYDKEGLPVRALKTNKLGQFTGSTPLPNGTYTLETEKDNFFFDVLQIELTGEVLSPLLITPK